MDTVKKLIIIFCAAFSGCAFAGVTIDGQYYDEAAPIYITEFPHTSASTAQESCTLRVANAGCTATVDWSPTFTQGGQCRATCGGWTGTYGIGVSCPSGYTGMVVSGVNRCLKPGQPVTCTPPQVLDSETNTCVCPSGPVTGTFIARGDVYLACNAGCQMVLRSGTYDAPTNYTVGWSWSRNGHICTNQPNAVSHSQDPIQNPADAPKPCPEKQCPGTVNGQSVCVPCGNLTETKDTTKTDTKTDTPPGGSSTTGTTTTKTSETTNCNGSQCTTTTTTTTTKPDGTKTDTNSTAVEPQSDYCTRNPNATICKQNDGSWSGNCGSFSCGGDAVQCAQARAAAELLCKFETPADSPQVTTSSQAIAGTLPNSTPEVLTSSIGEFNTTNPYSATCPNDVDVNVAGLASFTIPISRACPYISLIGWVLVAGATLAGARIAFT